MQPELEYKMKSTHNGLNATQTQKLSLDLLGSGRVEEFKDWDNLPELPARLQLIWFSSQVFVFLVTSASVVDCCVLLHRS